ncbi:glycosyltransferase [Winogradskyella sp. 3972H.M.0a.05]|uniref:glycosyltransferase family 2 protein n=1 Tax=Winogradskyella sp. 3972H.M.0a.05 TaxID=2950277 RepID=UPI0033934560
MTDKRPLVSICMPTYNGQDYLEEALNSALSQTYENIEIIISDDASNDNTLKIAEALLANQHIPSTILKHQPNGIGANWNNCIEHAKGAYIKFLFQDDILEENCISLMMKSMLQDDTIGLVYSKRNFIIDTPNEKTIAFKEYYGPLHTYWEDFKVKEGVEEGTMYLSDKQFLNSPKNKIGEPTSVLIKKACFDKVGYFSESLHQVLDCEFWYRLMPYYKIAFVDEYLAKFRVHDQQASAKNKEKKVKEEAQLYRSYYKNLLKYLHPKNKRKLLKQFHPLFKFGVTLKRKFDGRQ